MGIKFERLILVLLLVGGFAVRQYKIDNPVGDWHSWRQADTAAVTRNFVKQGVDIFTPRYDDFSDVSGNGLFNPQGYRLVEFPLFNLAHYSLYSLFPVNSLEYWGRMTSVLAALASAYLIHILVRRRSTPKTGLLAAFFYLFLPFNIYFTRVILPDPLMVTLYLASLNFFDLYFLNLKSYFLILGSLFGALALLVKPVAAFFILVPLVWNFYQRHKLKIFKKPEVWLAGLTITLPFLLWRIWEHRHPEGIPASIWLLNGDHIRFKGAFFRWIFGERIGNIILGNWGVFPLLSGVLALAGAAGNFVPWILGAGLYLFTFASGNVRHDYYQIPIIPVISIMLAFGTSYLWAAQAGFFRTWSQRGLAVVCILFMLGFSWYTIRGNFQINHYEIIKAGQAVDKLTEPDAKVIANYNGDTAFLYATNRQGFTHLPLPIKDLIDRYQIKYYVSVNYDGQTRAIMDKYIVLQESPEYVIVKLEEWRGLDPKPTPIPVNP